MNKMCNSPRRMDVWQRASRWGDPRRFTRTGAQTPGCRLFRGPRGRRRAYIAPGPREPALPRLPPSEVPKSVHSWETGAGKTNWNEA